MYIVRKYHVDNDSKKVFMDQLLDNQAAVNVDGVEVYGSASTVTRWYDELPKELIDKFNCEGANWQLVKFLDIYGHLLDVPAKTLYKHYEIPKRSGGTRPIDEPTSELVAALHELKRILTQCFFMSHHTNAFAYVKHRSTYDCVKRHKTNNWFMKTDFKNFFGSTTLETVLRMMEIIYPFGIFMKNPEYKANLVSALKLAFLDNGLPQGTTLSPDLTNLIMIPFDAKLSSILHSKSLTYTRYADDCIISGRTKFNKKFIEWQMIALLKELGYPYRINRDKTRFGSNRGKNWNLGLMLNADNNITIGAEAKHKLKIDLHKLTMDYKNIIAIDRDWFESLMGRISYYKYIEPSYVNKLIVKSVKSKCSGYTYYYFQPTEAFKQIISNVRKFPDPTNWHRVLR